MRPPKIAQPMPALGEAIAAAPTRPSDTLAILYTSGTTGPSKGVCCPHAQFFWWGVNTAHLLGVGADDVLCTTLPLFHTNALNTFFQALITGATAIFESRFSASAFFSTLAARRATVTYLLGAMVPILLSREAEPAEQAHRTRIALAPGVPGHFHAEFTKRTGIAILDGYGSTETNFVIGSPIAECKPGTMGRLFEGFAARVVDAEDNEVPDGTPGELMLRADGALCLRDRLLRHAREDGRGLAEPLVPHRRSRRPRARRLLQVRRPAEGRDPPARRERLLVRGRAGAAEPSRDRHRRRLSRCARSSPRTR